MHLLNTLPQRLDSGATPTFAGLIAPSLTSPAATNLTLAGGSTGASLVLGQGANASNELRTTGTGRVTMQGRQGTTIAQGNESILFSAQNQGPGNLQLALGMNETGGFFPWFQSYRVGGSSGSYLVLQPAAGNLLIGTTTDISGTGGLKVAGTSTASSTTSGALQVGSNVGLSGNSGGASYFGGNVVARAALGYATGIHSGSTADSSQQLILSSSGAYSNAYVSKNGTTLGIGFSSSNGSFVEDNALSIVAATKAATFAGAVTIAGTVIHTLSATPASATAAGTVGTMSWDTNYIYICTATNTWKRVALSTW